MKLIILRFAVKAPKVCDARPPPGREKKTLLFRSRDRQKHPF